MSDPTNVVLGYANIHEILTRLRPYEHVFDRPILDSPTAIGTILEREYSLTPEEIELVIGRIVQEGLMDPERYKRSLEG